MRSSFIQKGVYYPLLFGVLPVFILFTENLHITNWSEISRSLLVTFSATGAFFLLLRLIVRDWHRAGLVTVVAHFCFFSFGYLNQFLAGALSVPLEQAAVVSLAGVTAFLIISIWAVIRVARRPQALTAPLNFIATGLILINLLAAGVSSLRQAGPRPPDRAQVAALRSESSVAAAASSVQRDIYYIVLDGYTRADVLKELYGADNDDFLNFLTSQGFYIADQSHSNYSQTILSIGSALNYQYLDDLLPLDPRSDDRRALTERLVHGQVRQFLEARGYQIIAFDSGYGGTNLYDADRFIRRENQLNMFETTLLHNSMAVFVEAKLVRSLQYEAMKRQFSQLEAAAGEPGPKFVFAHFLVPHPPFFFDRGGGMREDTTLLFFDGSEYAGSPAEYQDGYREQLLFVSTRMQQVVAEILSHPGPRPIIVIQGDHGSGLYLDQTSFESSCLRERFSILNAYLLPDGGEEVLYPQITPVNTFRAIFNLYFDAELPLLEDQSYYSAMQTPFQFHRAAEEQLEQFCPLSPLK